MPLSHSVCHLSLFSPHPQNFQSSLAVISEKLQILSTVLFNPFLFSSRHILIFFSIVIFSGWIKRLLFWIWSLPIIVMFSSSLPPLWPLLPIIYLPSSGTVIPAIWFYLDLQSMDVTYLFTVTLSMISLHSWSSLNSICKQDITPVYISLPVLTSVFFLIKASKSICLLHTYTNESTGQEEKKIPCLPI